MTPTVGHQLNVPPVHMSCLVGGLAANRDLLGFVKGHLAADLTGFPCVVVADVGLDGQLVRLWDE